MTEQHHIETTRIQLSGRRRLRTLFAKRRSPDEHGKQRAIDVNRRAATQIRTMIARLKHDISKLEDRIKSDLERARMRDPSHHAYPISVRTWSARRENLKTTIAVLLERLALLDQAMNDP